MPEPRFARPPGEDRLDTVREQTNMTQISRFAKRKMSEILVPMTEPQPKTTPNDLIFVYGTLRPGFENPFARRLHKAARHLGPASVRGGRLVDLGSYPGFVPVEEDPPLEVRGDLFELPVGGDLLDALDAYEGCSRDPARPGEYRREKRPVRLGGNRTLSAWIYILNRPAERFPAVPGGDYLDYLSSR